MVTAATTSAVRFRSLPGRARLFVAGTMVFAAIVLIVRFPTSLPQPALFAAFAVASCLASAMKVKLPLGAGSSNLSVSYTVDFAGLLILGAGPTMLIAGFSALTQSTFNTAHRNPLYRKLFSTAALMLTVQGAGSMFTALGGDVGVFDAALVKPLVGAALGYYLLNTVLMAGAVGLSTGQRVWKVWQSNFLWTAPSYFVGAGAAAGAAGAWAAGWGWLLPLAVAPVYLTFRSYRVYLDRIAAEQRHHEEMMRLHSQTVDALKTAKESEQRYALAAAGSNDGLWDWDLVSDVFYASDRWKLMLGLPAETPLARVHDWFSYVHGEDLVELRTILDRHLAGEAPHFEHEFRMRHRDGADRWILCRGVAVRNDAGSPVRMAGSHTDITERRRIQDDLAHAALHDDLTGLANRTLFTALLERSLARARRSQGYVCAVLFVDIDHFKLVNDSLGHLVGDKFLLSMGRRFLEHLRPGDVLARLGGDEFAVLLDDIPDSSTATAIADRLHASLLQPIDLEGREVYSSASIGIAFGNSRYLRSEDLLRDADTAMYRAKALGRSQCQIFDPSMHASAIQRLTLETQLRRALERQEFSVAYQPIIQLDSSEVCGFEALVRWERPDGTATPPSEFIPVAEETGLIVPLTNWVLKEASRQVAEWQRTFGRPLTLTVNISAKLFDRPALVDEVRSAIVDSGLMHGTLRLEITESFLANGSDAVVQRLDELRSIPVELYLDDFGTGFSSLSYLHRYRLDALKIDQSFISRMGGMFNDSPIVSSIVNLARELGMGVIAEGVETPQQASQLMALECPQAQGFLFSRPLPAVDAYAFLSTRPLLKAQPVPEHAETVVRIDSSGGAIH
jgi:diguanylate cyclase (GGDEF)-like protein/PAS domain S-box-containing protein